ncbi:hypothetical protein H920_11910 [Fukomys damarensis]|uniref:Uncharacterized protein n=1 Tax=Fukomys damarensis TaxID=885580 RepID=A0A091D3Q1_FUKDA|nr:hypothetical protein H920_11910 [Fukomys damarensis]
MSALGHTDKDMFPLERSSFMPLCRLREQIEGLISVPTDNLCWAHFMLTQLSATNRDGKVDGCGDICRVESCCAMVDHVTILVQEAMSSRTELKTGLSSANEILFQTEE